MQHQYQQQQQQQQQPTTTTTTTTTTTSHLARPPFVDPTTNIIYDTDNPEYQGWLTKQSMWLKDWRRRYVLLKGSKLFFSKNAYASPHGMIDLAHCTTVKSADLKSQKVHSFEISTPEITYLLYADTEQEKDDWIGRVGKAIVRCSSTYYSASGPGSGAGTGAGSSQNGRPTIASPYGRNPLNPNMPHHQQQQQQQYDEDSDDSDILYEDPNNPNPYFND